MPSGLTAQPRTPSVWPVRVARSVPLAASQIFRVLSVLAETIQLPSGLTAQPFTASVWPVRVARSLPLAASQILRVPSMLAETIQVPSGLTAQVRSPCRCGR